MVQNDWFLLDDSRPVVGEVESLEQLVVHNSG